MFVVQVKGNFAKKNEEYFLNKDGKKTAYLGQAELYRTKAEGQEAGEKFVKSGKGHSFSVDRA